MPKLPKQKKTKVIRLPFQKVKQPSNPMGGMVHNFSVTVGKDSLVKEIRKSQ